MTERKMSCKGFLHKASGKAATSAIGFLAAHREWLTTGELAEKTSPILANLDKGEIMPTPCLETIKGIVLGHMIASDALKAEKALEEGPSTGKSQKPYLATIYDSTGTVCTRMTDDGDEKDLRQGFDHPQDAQRWCDRRLFDGAVDWFGVVEHTTSGYAENVLRLDSIARILKMPKGAVMRRQGAPSGPLGPQMKVKESRSRAGRTVR